MASLITDGLSWLLDEHTWRPPLHYAQIAEHGWPQHFPKFTHLSAALPYALAITFVRLVFIPCSTFVCRLLVPLSTEPAVSKPAPPAVREALSNYHAQQARKDRKAKKARTDPLERKREARGDWDALVKQVSASSDVSASELSLWSRGVKVRASNASKIKKFNEASWLFLFYLFIWIFGTQLLIQKDYFWDTRLCWADYLAQRVTSDVHAYYFLSLGHYLHLLVAQFFDVKRKDFVEMFVHHVVTIFLLVFSYVIGFVRVGTLVLWVHDFSDVLLQLAKLFNYTGYKKLTDATFVLFAISFAYFRLYLFPFWVINTTMFECVPIMMGPDSNFIGWWSFNILLWILEVLHIMWFAIIVRMAVSFLRAGEVKKDDRSESEGEEITADGDSDDAMPAPAAAPAATGMHTRSGGASKAEAQEPTPKKKESKKKK